MFADIFFFLSIKLRCIEIAWIGFGESGARIPKAESFCPLIPDF
jgi:hypothetical protein